MKPAAGPCGCIGECHRPYYDGCRHPDWQIEARRAAEAPRKTLSDGTQIYPEHRRIVPATGQQEGYVVLAEEERAKGFVRPVRDTYRHKVCGTVTTMGRTIAETYARDPKFYSGTFCVHCREHRPLAEFVWEDTNEVVGS